MAKCSSCGKMKCACGGMAHRKKKAMGGMSGSRTPSGSAMGAGGRTSSGSKKPSGGSFSKPMSRIGKAMGGPVTGELSPPMGPGDRMVMGPGFPGGPSLGGPKPVRPGFPSKPVLGGPGPLPPGVRPVRPGFPGKPGGSGKPILGGPGPLPPGNVTIGGGNSSVIQGPAPRMERQVMKKGGMAKKKSSMAGGAGSGVGRETKSMGKGVMRKGTVGKNR